jgi:DNA-directed RNA polymerase subunit F
MWMEGQIVSLAQVRDMLAAENEKRELPPMQKNALAQAEMCHITKEQADELFGKLMELDFLKDNEALAMKIVDILPKYPSDVRALCSKERLIRPLDADMIDQVLKLVEPYL